MFALPPASSTEASQFGSDVCIGLQKPHKEFPSKYLYDAVGSALFDVITLLPEYGLWRAEQRILSRFARDILARIGELATIVELGSGNSSKTNWILRAVGERPVRYCPIDISSTALSRSREVLRENPFVTFVGYKDEYLRGLQLAAASRGPGPLLVLFLGSSIGNFDREASEHFLRAAAQVLRSGDGLLLGTDLVKAPALLEAAYADSLGVTAAFNLNALARINRELGGDFALDRFQHIARYEPNTERIEMHLLSTLPQVATLSALDLRISLTAGETIWTESSHKYRLEDLPAFARRCGFMHVGHWVDDDWAFADSLWLVG
ncbi:MAG: L-histidine N(alpha)-methyltransferase [Bauldia sp.]